MIPLISSFVSPVMTRTYGQLTQTIVAYSGISDPDVLNNQLKTFEAVAPDNVTITGFALVTLLSIVAYFVWANEVVPVSRTKLALSKRDGTVRQYLDSLAAVDESEDSRENGIEKKLFNANQDGRDFERWLFSDWLNNNKSAKGGRKKPSALPILKNAKWNSGDNPVLVTSAMLMVGVFIAAVTERIAS